MSDRLIVSVVMSVHNGERFLRASLESVLSQQGVDLELVVVDDGSTDGSLGILREMAKADERVRILWQANVGLTRSLERGCREAKGRYIARQDADDLSFPGRLAKLAGVLDENPAAAVAASWVELVGPLDERLLTTRFPEGLEAGTRAVLAERRSPVHGSAMFRRRDLEAIGGYRPEFYFAQDSDLWFRLADRGGFLFLPEVLYGFRITAGSITGRNRDAQLRLYELAKACREARMEGRPEAPLLAAAAEVRPGGRAMRRRCRGDSASYFIGCSLLKRGHPGALGYFLSHLRARPLDPRGWVRLFQAAFVAALGRQTTKEVIAE